jgi:hypothetical protein
VINGLLTGKEFCILGGLNVARWPYTRTDWCSFVIFLSLAWVGVAQSVQWLGHLLHDRRSIHGRGKEGNLSLRHRVQTDFGAHRTLYPMDTGNYFPEDKTAGAWLWPLTFI